MLNNKSGMLKVVALVLSVLMLVSLAACNKGVDDETMQNAIDAAIASQKAEQDAANAAIQSSIAADQAAQDAANAALQSSILAEQAKQSEALAAASKAQAEAAASIAAASKAAADAAASASKAAADAAAASKAAASASAAAAAQASASASASVAASISASISASEAALTTTAPAKEDITSYVTKFAELRASYLLTNKAYYLEENYEELDALFVKASIELTNAMTVAQAEAIYTALEVDAAGIESAKTRANEVKAMVEALNDIETEVFTTQADMIVEALDALEALNEDYEDLDATALKTAKKVINVADLNKAKAKLVVLEAYIESALQADMAKIYKMDPKVKYDAEDDLAQFQAVVEDAYYKYLVLNKINGGDVAAADLDVEFEYYDKNGKEIDAEEYNPKTDSIVVVKTFTVESLVEDYILPTLDAKFEVAKETAYNTLVADLNKTLYNKIAADVDYIAEWSDVEDLFEDVSDQFEIDIEDITFTGDYKGNVVYADALKEINVIFAKAYVDAVAGIVEISKEIAIEEYTENVYDVTVENLEKQYEDEKYADTLKAKLDVAAENLAAFKANVEAAPVYDLDTMNEARDVENIEDLYVTITEGKKSDLYDYVNTVVIDTIANNFKTRVTSGSQAGMLRAIAIVLVEDLQNLRIALNIEEEGALWNEFKGSDITPIWVTDSKTYKNDAAIANLVAAIDKAIETIEGIDEAAYTDKAQNIVYKEIKDSKAADYKWSKKTLYFQGQEAYDFAVENDLTEAELINSTYRTALLTIDKTDYPLTYNFSATEQACVDAYEAYTDAYNAVHNGLTAIYNPTSAAQKLITNDANYKAVVTNVSTNAALKAEVEAFAKIYTDEMAKLIAIGKVDALPGSVKTSWTVNTQHVTLNAADLNQAATYVAAALSNSENISGAKQFGAAADAMYAQFEKFEGLFWADKATKTSNVVELYKYKVAAVAAVEAEMVKYVHKYSTDKDGVVSTTTSDRFYTYAGVTDGKKAPAATLYENALATLVDKYSDSIMAVKLSDAAKIESVAGKKVILAKGTAGIDNAKAMVDAYQTKLFGIEPSTWTLDEVTYVNADSETFLAFKQYILVNYDTIDATTIKY